VAVGGGPASAAGGHQDQGQAQGRSLEEPRRAHATPLPVSSSISNDRAGGGSRGEGSPKVVLRICEGRVRGNPAAQIASVKGGRTSYTAGGGTRMRHKRWLGWIAVFLVGALLAACGGSPQPGAGDATEPGTDQGSTDGAAGVDWEIPAIDQLPDEVAAWVEQ